MAEGGSGRMFDDGRRDKVPDISSLDLGVASNAAVLCREHSQEVKHFCKAHLAEVCRMCIRKEHKHCKTVIDIDEAAETIYSNVHADRIIQSLKDLSERFKDIKAVIESLKTYKRTDFGQDYMQEYMNDLKDKLNVCDSLLSSLSTSSSEIETASNTVEKFIATNKATKKVKQYCKMLLEMRREISEINVELKLISEEAMRLWEEYLKYLNIECQIGVEFRKGYETVGKTDAMIKRKVDDMFSDKTPIYTGELRVSPISNKPPCVTSFCVLQNKSKLVLDYNYDKIQLYDKNNTFVNEAALPVTEGEKCISVTTARSSTEALVTTTKGRHFAVIVSKDLVVSEINQGTCIMKMKKCDDDILNVIGDSDLYQLCEVDNKLKKIVKALLLNDGTLVCAPILFSVSAEENTAYVLDCVNGYYEIKLPVGVIFTHREIRNKSGLIITDGDGQIVETFEKGEFQLENVKFSCEQQGEVCTIFAKSYPLKMAEDELVVFQTDNNTDCYLRFYCLMKQFDKIIQKQRTFPRMIIPFNFK